MPDLQIHPGRADGALTRHQRRFNTLLKQVEKARDTLSAWQEQMAAWRQGHHELLEPLQAQLLALQRQWAGALAAADTRGLVRWQRELLDEIRCHAGSPLGDEGGEEQLLQALRQREAARAARRARRGQGAGQRQEAEAAQQATQSVREVFRKLASALHPDREPDPDERARKNALMAQANAAHARADLLTLLELQLRTEQIDAEHLATVDDRRLQHYAKVLAQQVGQLQREINAFHQQVAADCGDFLPAGLQPGHLPRLLEDQAGRLRAAIAQRRRELELLARPGGIKQWLAERGQR